MDFWEKQRYQYQDIIYYIDNEDNEISMPFSDYLIRLYTSEKTKLIKNSELTKEQRAFLDNTELNSSYFVVVNIECGVFKTIIIKSFTNYTDAYNGYLQHLEYSYQNDPGAMVAFKK